MQTLLLVCSERKTPQGSCKSSSILLHMSDLLIDRLFVGLVIRLEFWLPVCGFIQQKKKEKKKRKKLKDIRFFWFFLAARLLSSLSNLLISILVSPTSPPPPPASTDDEITLLLPLW